MMEFENIKKIQLIDTPPIAPQSVEFWLPALLRKADALLVMVDLRNDPLAQMETITNELGNRRIGFGSRRADDEQDLPLDLKKALIVGNKIDQPEASQNYSVLQELYQDELPVVAISAKTGTGLEELKLKIYQMLDIIRVYTKTPGQKADLNDPIVLARGSTLEDAAAEIHKSFLARLKYARVWGSGKHDGIMVKRDHILEDGDVIELHV
jgi:ribosome-interacting GTPase 1